MSRWWGIVLMIAAATAVAGELKISPFSGTFRISMGSAVFFFLLIVFKPRFLPAAGAAVGTVVCLFRAAGDMLTGSGEDWSGRFAAHFPALWYYVAFAALLAAVSYIRFLPSPLLFGAMGGLIDFSSNLVELAARMMLQDQEIGLLENAPALGVVGLLRSFLVVGLYNMLEMRQLKAVSREQQKRMEQLLLIFSELHEECISLQKMAAQVEQITANSYQLYKKLTGDPRAREALRLAENVHEVKKDAQRMIAGLSKLIRQEAVPERMALGEVVGLVAKANETYAEHLGKRIEIRVAVAAEHKTDRFYSLLSLLNNLVANAVEAIVTEGRIDLCAFVRGDEVWFEIGDDGPGIPERDRELIFEPGYTTKYDRCGNASTGIGLCHVRSTLDQLGGRLEVGESEYGGALFRVIVPVRSLERDHGERVNWGP